MFMTGMATLFNKLITISILTSVTIRVSVISFLSVSLDSTKTMGLASTTTILDIHVTRN